MKKCLRFSLLAALILPSVSYADCEAEKYADADLIAFVRPSIAVASRNANPRTCNGSRCTEFIDGPPVEHEVSFIVEKPMMGLKKGAAVTISIPLDVSLTPDILYYVAAYKKEAASYIVYPCGIIFPQTAADKN